MQTKQTSARRRAPLQIELFARETAEGDRRRAGLVRLADGDTDSTDRLDDTVASGARRQERGWLDEGDRS